MAIQAGILRAFGVRQRLASSPGSISGAETSTIYTSRRWRPSPRPAADAVITVSAGAEYRLNGGAWTSAPGVWGTSSYIEVRGESSASSETTVDHTTTIGGIGHVFTLVTLATTVDGWIDETGAAWIDENGSTWA